MPKDKKEEPKPLPKLELSPAQLDKNPIKFAIPREDDKPKEGEKWQDYFYVAFKRIQEVRDWDLGTSEGEGKLHNTLNNPGYTKSLDTKTLSGARDNLVNVANSGLMANSLRNLEGLVGTFDGAPKQASSLAMGLPSFYAPNSSEPYKAAVQAVATAQEVAKATEDPRSYILSKFGKDSNPNKLTSTQLFWLSYAEETVNADARISQAMATRAMRAFGSEQKFLTASLKTARELSEQFDKGELEFQKAIKVYGESAGDYLTAEQERTFLEDYRKSNAVSFESYKQAAGAKKMLPQMVDRVQRIAYGVIDEKKKAEANAKASKSKS